MSRWKKYLLITCGTLLGLLLLSMLVVPWQIKKQGSAWIAKNTSRTLKIDKVFFNPFTLTVELEGLKLSEQNSAATFLSFKRLMLSGSTRSLIDLAVILDRVELDDPFVNIELLGRQKFNFSDFTHLKKNSTQKKETAAAKQRRRPFYFSFNNIVITGGRINFTDQTSEKKTQHRIRKLRLSVPFIGNMPYLTDNYVKPRLSLLLNGSELRAEGELKPFKKSLETTLTLTLNDIDLSFYALHSPLPLPVEVKSGVLDSQIDLSYRVSMTEQPKLMLGGVLALSNINIRELDGKDLFKMPSLILDLDWANLIQRDFNLKSLAIYQPELYVERNRKGRWNLLDLLPAPAKHPVDGASGKASPEARLPLLTIGQLTLQGGKVHYHDDYPSGGFQETVEGIQLQLDNFSTHLAQKTKLSFKLRTTRGTHLTVAGSLGLNPLSADWGVQLEDWSLKPYNPFLSDLLTQPLDGNLSLATHLQLGPQISLKLEPIRLNLRQLVVPFNDQDHFNLKSLNLKGGSFDLGQHLLRIASLKLRGGDLRAQRNADGSLSPLALLRKQDKNKPVPAETRAGSASVTLPWQKSAIQIGADVFNLRFDHIALEKFALQLSDASLAKKPQLKIARLDLDLKNLAYPKSRQSPFRLRANIGHRGAISLSGTLAHSPLRVQARTKIKALPLTLINGFLPRQIKASLRDGQLYSSLGLKLAQRPDRLTGSFSGRINISNFKLRDPLGDEELLSWKNLQVEGIKGEISPPKLRIKKVALSDYLAKIQIDSQGRINLTHVTASTEPKAEKSSNEAPPVAANPVKKTEAPPDIRIDAVTLQGGTVAFTDRHLPSTFSTTMYQLGGRISGLASDAAMPADVDLRGQLENHAPLTISGKLNPLSKDLFAELKIHFKDIDLVPMTPYSGTFLGYAIDKGKLYLDLNYQIKHRKISADNKVMIDQFTFGDSVKSDQATALPVSLAIALLKDRSGEIHLDLPISGNLDDPSFSVAGTVFTILKNLLVKAATSPFVLLGSMFGGHEDFSSVVFAAGSDTLSEGQQQKLTKLADMLEQRPSLTLEISAFADQDKDPEAYRQRKLQQMLSAAKVAAQKDAGKAPLSAAKVLISASEYPKYLTRVYKDADFPRPRNFIGMLKKLPVAEMKKLLLTNIRAGDEQLRQLASKRAMVVRDALNSTHEKIKAQIFLKNVDIFQKPKTGIGSRVEFGISSK